MRVLGVDPGQHNGYAVLELKDKIISLLDGGTIERLDFYKRLPEMITSIEIIVAEDFRVRPGQARLGAFDFDRMVACQVLGVLEFLTVHSPTELKLQAASIKPVGFGFLGKPYRKGAKNVHHWDAAAHAVYYLVTQHGAVPPAGLKALKGQPLQIPPTKT